MPPPKFSAAAKELARLVRDRLEACFVQSEAHDYAAIEALIILEKAAEEAERGDPAFASRMTWLASELLMETPLPSDERELLDRWMVRMKRRDTAAADG